MHSTFYSDILPETSAKQALGEWNVWRQEWLNRPEFERPRDAVAALCDRLCFPTIHALLHICACQPVTSAAAEVIFHSQATGNLDPQHDEQMPSDRLGTDELPPTNVERGRC